eukprot:360264-Chlamydomonas_euryale.AAC.6
MDALGDCLQHATARCCSDEMARSSVGTPPIESTPMKWEITGRELQGAAGRDPPRVCMCHAAGLVFLMRHSAEVWPSGVTASWA